MSIGPPPLAANLALAASRFRCWLYQRDRDSPSNAETPSPEKSLTMLVLLLGPWPDPPGPVGERFAERFLAAPHLAGQFLPDSADVVQRVARRFDAIKAPLSEVDLLPLEPEERTLLMKLVTQLYSLTEIHRLATNQPPYGKCQNDGTWHTQPPVKS